MSDIDPLKIKIKEGDCFGWYSSVTTKCQPSVCMLSERCKHHTTLMQTSNHAEVEVNIMNDSIKKTSKELKKEKEEKKMQEELYQKSVFEEVLNHLKPHIDHKNFHKNKNLTYYSFKKDKQVVASLYRNKSMISFLIKKEDEDENKIEESFDSTVDEIKDNFLKFLKENS